MSNPKIWLITGCSTGFGRALALAAAQAGDIVYGTVRNEEQIQALEALVPGKIHGLILDVTDAQAVPEQVAKIVSAHGQVSVLVNNAGYGSLGPVEEVNEEEVLRQFDVNVFGALRMIRAVLPAMRRHKNGHIINITSIAGLSGGSGFGIYNGSKFALEGIGEGLAQDVKHLGIYVTNVEPGPFRTDWAGRSATYTLPAHEDYMESAGKSLTWLQSISGNQTGDPVKGAEAMVALTRLENPPVHLPLGAIAYKRARQKFHSFLEELDQFQNVGLPTDFE